MIEVIPSILEKEFDVIKRRIELVKDAVDWIEIDILDNTLYQNVTYNQFDSFTLYSSQVDLAAHLMVSDPAKYVEPLVKAGFKRLITDVEADTVREFIEQGRMSEVEVGVALNGPSHVDLLEPYLDSIDTVLFLTVPAGLSGQVFMPEVLKKIKLVHDEYRDLPIEVDGGINKETAPLVKDVGATRLAVTSYLFWKNPDRIEEAIEDLK